MCIYMIVLLLTALICRINKMLEKDVHAWKESLLHDFSIIKFALSSYQKNEETYDKEDKPRCQNNEKLRLLSL